MIANCKMQLVIVKSFGLMFDKFKLGSNFKDSNNIGNNLI